MFFLSCVLILWSSAFYKNIMSIYNSDNAHLA